MLGPTPPRMECRLVIESYFDDSGTSGKNHGKWYCLAGYVVAGDTAHRFGEEWGVALASESWPPLHMKDFTGIANKRGWGTEQREAFLQNLTGFVNKYPMKGVVIAIDLDAYSKMSKSHRKQFKSAQTFAMIRAVLVVTRKLKYAGVVGPLQIVLDQDYQYAKERLEYYLTARRQLPWLRDYFTAITFADARCFPVLQAADLLVWTARREIEAIDRDPASIENRLRKLQSLGNVERPEIWTDDRIAAEFERAATELSTAEKFAAAISSAILED